MAGQLRNNTAGGVRTEFKSDRSVLVGKIFDKTSHPLTPSHAVKGGRRYRYYVSRQLLTPGMQRRTRRMALARDRVGTRPNRRSEADASRS